MPFPDMNGAHVDMVVDDGGGRDTHSRMALLPLLMMRGMMMTMTMVLECAD